MTSLAGSSTAMSKMFASMATRSILWAGLGRQSLLNSGITWMLANVATLSTPFMQANSTASIFSGKVFLLLARAGQVVTASFAYTAQGGETLRTLQTFDQSFSLVLGKSGWTTGSMPFVSNKSAIATHFWVSWVNMGS
jgi:hypothetical protein